MQEAVVKTLEIRKRNGSSLLSVSLERALPNSDTLERAKPHNDSPALVEIYSSLASDVNLLKSVKRLMQVKADEPLDMNWADKRELKTLYLLASLLQVALKEKKIVKHDKVEERNPFHMKSFPEHPLC
ncbi:UNVERIFIED_CONTAM: hypothetical protein K2H54_060009 [Gekko kuhli]